MTRQTILILTFSIILLSGCDFKEQVKDTVDSGVKLAKTEMDADISNAKLSFIESYKKVIGTLTDSLVLTRITSLNISINNTVQYIDSLRDEMEKLDNLDINNTEFVKRTFLNNGIGDSIFNKVKSSYTFAIDIASSDTTKSRLTIVRDSYNSDTKNQFFELNGPLGVNMILYGIETELIRDGTKSLYGYSR
jgi:hypothetical protein